MVQSDIKMLFVSIPRSEEVNPKKLAARAVITAVERPTIRRLGGGAVAGHVLYSSTGADLDVPSIRSSSRGSE